MYRTWLRNIHTILLYFALKKKEENILRAISVVRDMICIVYTSVCIYSIQNALDLLLNELLCFVIPGYQVKVIAM